MLKKFNAWDGKKMHYNVNINQGRGVVPGYQWFNEENTIKEGDPLLQFTGLTDKNGVDIYEGDIVLVKYNRMGNKEVVFENGAYNISRFDIGRCRVVGNIYENPELLGGES